VEIICTNMPKLTGLSTKLAIGFSGIARLSFVQHSPQHTSTIIPLGCSRCRFRESTRMNRIIGIVIVAAIGIANIVAIISRDRFVGSKVFAADQPVVRTDSKIQHLDLPTAGRPKNISATCTAWTDSCRACGRGPDGVFCSNVGIACQSSETHCVRPE
jgi:hypothetical protein